MFYKYGILGNYKSMVFTFCLCLNTGLAFSATNYYVSSSGKDMNSGLSPESPIRTFEKVKALNLKPGDTVHFKSGDTFIGQLVINESGLAGKPIHFTSYGEGDKPIIDGGPMKGGSALAAILIENQDHIEISHLTIKNFRKKTRHNTADVNAYGLLVKNTGKRDLHGFEFHHLTVEDVYPVRARDSFNQTSVTGIRIETVAAKSNKKAFGTHDIYIHNNVLRGTARFGIATRHKPSFLDGVKDTSADYDQNIRITENRCEDLGGSCVLMNGVWNGLLEKNEFIRSGALVEPDLSVNRGSGAWFFRSKNIVAQHNTSIGSRGHNDSAGLHVDFSNENILVQYNYFFDNEGYGTEILGKNKNVIWRYNISVADGFRKVGVPRPEGGKSQYPGKTIFVSDFAVPKRVLSDGVYIYNNTYIVDKEADPLIEINANNAHVWNNVIAVEKGGRVGRKVTLGWSEGDAVDVRGNVFSGNISPNLKRLDPKGLDLELIIAGDADEPSSFAVNRKQLQAHDYGIQVEHPVFPEAGKGIFKHVSAVPEHDFFGNPLSEHIVVGAGH